MGAGAGVVVLGGGQDAEGHRKHQVLSEIAQVELGGSKLPFHISISLWSRT